MNAPWRLGRGRAPTCCGWPGGFERWSGWTCLWAWRAELARRSVTVGGGALLVCADGEQLAVASDAFDVVSMIFTLELFDTPHIPMVRAACGRVQRPGGRLGVVALLGRNLILGRRRYESTHDRFLTAVDCRPIYAHRAVESGGFVLTHALVDGPWGMSVEIVVAANTD